MKRVLCYDKNIRTGMDSERSRCLLKKIFFFYISFCHSDIVFLSPPKPSLSLCLFVFLSGPGWVLLCSEPRR